MMIMMIDVRIQLLTVILSLYSSDSCCPISHSYHHFLVALYQITNDSIEYLVSIRPVEHRRRPLSRSCTQRISSHLDDTGRGRCRETVFHIINLRFYRDFASRCNIDIINFFTLFVNIGFLFNNLTYYFKLVGTYYFMVFEYRLLDKTYDRNKCVLYII